MVDKRSNHQNQKIHQKNKSNYFKKRLQRETDIKTKNQSKWWKVNEANKSVSKEPSIKTKSIKKWKKAKQLFE
jgi:hypothetical protein